jgi:ferredoxin-like protein FixX
MPSKITLTCEHCQRPFERKPSETGSSGRQFCCRACFNAATTERVEVRCLECGTPFVTSRKRIEDGRGKFCSKQCQYAAQSGERSPQWKGGRIRTATGYIELTINRERVPEHRFVAEKMIGRPLRTDEHVHHLDGNRSNNAPENLRVMTASEHMEFTAMRGRVGAWAREYDACVECGKTRFSHVGRGLCRRCYARLRRRHHAHTDTA